MTEQSKSFAFNAFLLGMAVGVILGAVIMGRVEPSIARCVVAWHDARTASDSLAAIHSGCPEERSHD